MRKKEKERETAIPPVDSVKRDLRDLKKVPLLSRDQEIEIFTRIDNNKKEIFRLLILCLFFQRKLLEMISQILAGDIPVNKLIQKSKTLTPEQELLLLDVQSVLKAELPEASKNLNMEKRGEVLNRIFDLRLQPHIIVKAEHKVKDIIREAGELMKKLESIEMGITDIERECQTIARDEIREKKEIASKTRELEKSLRELLVNKGQTKRIIRNLETEAGMSIQRIQIIMNDIIDYEKEVNKDLEKIVDANPTLVNLFSNKFTVGEKDPFIKEELLQIGKEELIRVALKFDISKGFRFSTYASKFIKRAIQREASKKGHEISIPRYIHDEQGRVNKASSQLTQILGRKPTQEEIAKFMRKSSGHIRKIQKYEYNTVDFDRNEGEDQQENLGEYYQGLKIEPSKQSNIKEELSEKGEIIDSEDLIKKKQIQEINETIKMSLSELTKRQNRVIQLRYGIEDGQERTPQQVASLFNLSRQRIHQIETEALKKIFQFVLRDLSIDINTSNRKEISQYIKMILVKIGTQDC